MRALAPERTVLAPDMPAHGRSSYLAPQHTVAWFNAWLDVMQLERIDLCAHSMGGSLAVRYTAAYPHRVRRLILCSPTSFGLGFPRITLLPRPGHFSDDLLDYLWGAPQRLTPGQRHQFNLILKEFFSSGRWWWYASGGFEWLLDLPTTRLRRLRTPTLVLWGNRDRLVPMNAEQVALIPNAQVKIFEGVGHMPYMEVQKEFDEAVKEFLI